MEVAATGSIVAPFTSTVLVDGLDSRVEHIRMRNHSLLRKTYTTARSVLWRTLFRRSRAQREHGNLAWLASIGIPTVEALNWSEERTLGCVTTCVLTTRFLEQSRDLRTTLASCNDPARRRQLAIEMGRLLRQLHDSGVCSTTSSPRNVLVSDRPGRPVLTLCDQPFVSRVGSSPWRRSLIDVDVYDVFFSTRRRSDWSSAERLRGLLAYHAGDRSAVRDTWQRLSGRRRSRVSIAREMHRFLSHLRPQPAPSRAPDEAEASASPELPMSRAKIDNYLSTRGAEAYRADHEQKLHRRLSDRRERRILTGFLESLPADGRLLDMPCGFGRFLTLFAERAAHVVEADISPSMLELNESLHPELGAEYLQCSALDVPRKDLSFDTVVSIRLSHHLDREVDREAHLGELCRLSRDAVIFTFFSATSLKNRLRRIRATWNGKRPKNTLSPQRVRGILADHGFSLREMKSLSRIGSGHVYALARRAVPTGSAAPEVA